MKLNGTLVSASRDLASGNILITFAVNCAENLEDIKNVLLDINISKHRKSRSLDANRMLWVCLGEISHVTGRSAWEEYLAALKRYGQFTYIVVKERAVEAVKAQWRECEVVGEVDINGTKGIQMLCYFGSSTYDSKEFSHLLNGVVDDMKDLGLQPPPSADMRRAIARLEKKEHEENTREQAY